MSQKVYFYARLNSKPINTDYRDFKPYKSDLIISLRLLKNSDNDIW